MRPDWHRARLLLIRALKLRCPECGEAPIYETVITVRHHCPNCGLIFKREQGYFIGAVYFNVIVTESLLFGALMISFVVAPSTDLPVYKILLGLAVILPVLFFRHSRSLWLCFDHFFDPMREHVGVDLFD
jgi:uncharacterized protein (DUF983 family)